MIEKNVFDKVCFYIENLTENTTEEEIRILLKKYGEVMKCDLSFGKAYVEMNSATNVRQIKLDMHGMSYYENRPLLIHVDTHSLRLAKLSSWIPHDLLEKAFGASRSNVYSMIFTDPKEENIAEGIVKFQTQTDSQMVLKRSQQCYISISDSPPTNEQNNANYVFKYENLPRKTPKFCTVIKKRLKSNSSESRITRKYNKLWEEMCKEYEKRKKKLDQTLMLGRMMVEAERKYEFENMFLNKKKRIAFYEKVIMKVLGKVI